MGDYRLQQLIKYIEDNSGPQRLGSAVKDLSGIDLSPESIKAELERRGSADLAAFPAWVHWDKETGQVLGINLRDARLEGANLQGARLEGANLQGARLKGANLQDARLMGANLQEAWLEGADLRTARLVGANLQRARLVGANLRGAWLGRADLRESWFFGANLEKAIFGGANLQKARLVGADLTRVDLRSAGSTERLYLHLAIFDHTPLTKEQLKGGVGEEQEGWYYLARETYLALKNNFETIGRYDDAAWAYIQERKMEKMMHHPKVLSRYLFTEEEERLKPSVFPKDWNIDEIKKGSGWFKLRYMAKRVPKWVVDVTVEELCEYGQNILRIIRTLFIVWVAFAVFYGLAAGVWGPEQRIGGEVVRYITLNPFDLLWFSLGAMTTANLPGLQARSTPVMHFLISLEPLLAIALTGLLGFVLGNRVRRS